MGEVLYVDRFGTLISNIPGPEVEPGVRIRVAARMWARCVAHSATSSAARWWRFVGSGGTVEIAVRDGSAARLLGVGVGRKCGREGQLR